MLVEDSKKKKKKKKKVTALMFMFISKLRFPKKVSIVTILKIPQLKALILK